MTEEKRDWQADWEMCEKASPGPWEVLKDAGKVDRISWEIEILTDGKKELETRQDMEFCAMAREALPYWLQRCKELESELCLAKDDFEDEIRRLGDNVVQKANSEQNLLERCKELEEALIHERVLRNDEKTSDENYAPVTHAVEQLKKEGMI
jgi:hypothetical protein